MISIFITGANGLLGSNLCQYFNKYHLGLSIRSKKNVFDNCNYFVNKDIASLNKNLLKFKPTIIINTVGLANVDECEKYKKKAKLSNIDYAINLSKISKRLKSKLVHISTDHLFDDSKLKYSETDKTNPINFYAKTKLIAENKILKINKDALILRTNFFDWGPISNPSFLDKIYNNLVIQKKIDLFSDVYFNPLSIKELAIVIEKLFVLNKKGIFNLSSNESITKYQFGLLVADVFNLNKKLINPISKNKLNIAKRPHNLCLSNSKVKKNLNIKFKSVKKMLIDLKKNKTSNKNIEFLAYGKHFIDKDDIKNVVNTLNSPNLTQGNQVDKFENKIAEYVGSKYAVAVSSCTAGLHLSCMVSGLDNKKNFLTSPLSFVSTANAGVYLNSKPFFADIDENTLNISNENAIIQNNKNKIDTIIPVHFSGYPSDMKKISKIFKQKSTIIEDAAHALGAKYSDGNMVGSCKYSDMCVFSFHPVKIIASGEGGIVTTNNSYIYKELLKLRSHGINKLDENLINKKLAFDKHNIQNIWYYEMQKLGFHYRLTDIQSSLAISQLKKINKFLNKRLMLSRRYSKLLKKFKNIKPAQNIDYKFSSNHLFVIKINFEKISICRNELMIKLRNLNIGSQVHYLPIFLQPFYKKYKFNPLLFPNVMNYYNSCLSLPLYYQLTIEQQDFIIEKLYELVE